MGTHVLRSSLGLNFETSASASCFGLPWEIGMSSGGGCTDIVVAGNVKFMTENSAERKMVG